MRIRPLLFLSACVCLGQVGRVEAMGILVKFLPNPPEDSIVRYDVYRADSAGRPGLPIGEILPAPGQDTLRFPDVSAAKGRAYFYTVTAVNAAGAESDLSDETEVGIPSLALPDTLRPDAQGITQVTVPFAAAPLKGFATLALETPDSARFVLRYDDASGRAVFGSRSGRADTAKIIVRASYFGKFEDRDTVIVMMAAGLPATANPPLTASRLRFLRAPAGALRISGLPARAELQVFDALGTRLRRALVTGPEAVLAAGDEPPGYHAGYLAIRDGEGRLLASLPLPPRP